MSSLRQHLSSHNQGTMDRQEHEAVPSNYPSSTNLPSSVLNSSKAGPSGSTTITPQASAQKVPSLTSSSGASQSSFSSDNDYLHDLFPQVPRSKLS